MKAPTLARSSILLAACLVAGGSIAAAHAQSSPAPTPKVRDRWVYNVTSGVGLSTINYQETREVTAVGAGGIKVTITGKTATGTDFSRVEEYAAPGSIRLGALCVDEVRRFPTPL